MDILQIAYFQSILGILFFGIKLKFVTSHFRHKDKDFIERLFKNHQKSTKKILKNNLIPEKREKKTIFFSLDIL